MQETLHFQVFYINSSASFFFLFFFLTKNQIKLLQNDDPSNESNEKKKKNDFPIFQAGKTWLNLFPSFNLNLFFLDLIRGWMDGKAFFPFSFFIVYYFQRVRKLGHGETKKITLIKIFFFYFLFFILFYFIFFGNFFFSILFCHVRRVNKGEKHVVQCRHVEIKNRFLGFVGHKSAHVTVNTCPCDAFFFFFRWRKIGGRKKRLPSSHIFFNILQYNIRVKKEKLFFFLPPRNPSFLTSFFFGKEKLYNGRETRGGGVK